VYKYFDYLLIKIKNIWYRSSIKMFDYYIEIVVIYDIVRLISDNRKLKIKWTWRYIWSGGIW